MHRDQATRRTAQRSSAPRTSCVGALCSLLIACGGGGGSSGDTAPPTPPPPAPAGSIEVTDALPSASATAADPTFADVALAHLGYADFAFEVTGDCDGSVTLARSVRDLSVDFDTLYEHRMQCADLADNAAVRIEVNATRDDGERFATELAFSTGTPTAPPLVVQDSVATPRDTVNGLFETYIDESLLPSLELPGAVEALVASLVLTIADTAWTNLVAPEATYAVVSQRISYASRTPAGDATDALTGLVAFPDPSAPFARRDQVIVLSHSTGVTPSDLDPGDAWFAIANLLASRGYLVIAPDNWGRGGTAAEIETYLMGTRTAANSLDMLRAVLSAPEYGEIVDTDNLELVLIGYSQGGHSVMPLWQALVRHAPEYPVAAVYTGGAPHNLYATVTGVIHHASDTCTGDAYCRYVDAATSVPFATERILPGYLAYLDTPLSESEVIAGDSLAPSFVDAYLTNDPSTDILKTTLQQGSFTNFDYAAAFPLASARFVVYHSEFDRLVADANSAELIAALTSAELNVDDRSARCSTASYQSIFEVTDFVGISHALCGVDMLDDAFDALR